MNISYLQASIVKTLLLKSTEDITDWETIHQNLLVNDKWLSVLKDLGISERVRDELLIGYENKNGIAFPVFLFGKIVDVVTYRPNQKPKTLIRKGSKTGMIVPFDIWKDTPKNKTTIICAGEKDMAIARTMGFNAISITGGENSIPSLFLEYFKDRPVAIVYDNDIAGSNGATGLVQDKGKPSIKDTDNKKEAVDTDTSLEQFYKHLIN